MHKTDSEIIRHIVEQVIDRKLTCDYSPQLLEVSADPLSDELDLIKYYINNQHLVTPQLIKDIANQQLELYPLETIAYDTKTSSNWEQYVEKLEKILSQVRYRRDNNYEFNDLMPPMQQLLQLQQECLQLTQEWYGVGNGNISCFYLYFIAMSQAAYVTCFEYDDIKKFISQDHYISQVDLQKRSELYAFHEEHFFHEFVRQGGRWARGRSEIDATSISNIFFYKTAQLLFYHLYAKNLLVHELQLENYGQLDFEKRVQLWDLLQHHFPDNTKDATKSIFYKFVQYINATPGEYFNYFSKELPEAAMVAPQKLFDIIKVAGIQSGHLILLSRNFVDNWPPKRNLSMHWIRKYALPGASSANHHEWPRIWPNEIPYTPSHGLSLCGNGLVQGYESYGTIDYEWDTPIDPVACETNIARDIEKLFRELKILSPNIKLRNLLPGEQLLSVFQNAIAYSTIKITQHTHIMRGTIDSYLLYNMSSTDKHKISDLNIELEFVPQGTKVDAFFIKVLFKELDNEPLIEFLVNMNQAYLDHFGADKVDSYIHLFSCKDGSYVFIYEPHARLIQLEPNQFLNPELNIISERRPQLIKPEGPEIEHFKNNLAFGREYLVSLFDSTCKVGAYKFLNDYIKGKVNKVN